MTNREAHEEAAGMNLENIFFELSGIDPDGDYCEDEELECVICAGSGYIENPDPMWYGFDVDEIRCDSCGGSGLRKDQTYW